MILFLKLTVTVSVLLNCKSSEEEDDDHRRAFLCLLLHRCPLFLLPVSCRCCGSQTLGRLLQRHLLRVTVRGFPVRA